MAVHSSVPVWLSDSIRVIHEPALDTQAGASVGNEIQPQTSESFQFLGAELKETADETLFLELALRGYDLSKPLRPDIEEPSETAEIVKIG